MTATKYETPQEMLDRIENQVLPELKATLDNPTASQETKDRAAVILRIYKAAYKFSFDRDGKDADAKIVAGYELGLLEMVPQYDLARLAESEAEWSSARIV